MLSPLLFNLYMAEIEERMKNQGIEGVGIGKMRIWNLAYADNIGRVPIYTASTENL